MFFKKPAPPNGAQPTILTLKRELGDVNTFLKHNMVYREEMVTLTELVNLQGQQIAALKLDLEELNKRQQSPAPQPPKRTTKKKVEGDS